MKLDRRTLLLAGASTLVARGETAQPETAPIPVIDTHIHLWDLSRPQGAPFPPKDIQAKHNLPDVMSAKVYHRQAAAEGLVGAIHVDASPWMEDNLWVLENCAEDDIMVGVVGNLKPEAKEFPEYLERYHKNPLFRGIRYGNIWGYNIVEQVTNPAFIAGLKLLAQAGLVLDVGNPEIELLRTTVRLSDAVPELTIVVEHLEWFYPPAEVERDYERILREMQQRPQLYGKIGIGPSADGELKNGLPEHRANLERLHTTFGEDRVMGCGFHKDYAGLQILQSFYATKSREAQEKFFWKNSIKAYKWVHRRPDQPQLV
jgi:predicted TIM-barrel fold metal-dependent hydrolase